MNLAPCEEHHLSLHQIIMGTLTHLPADLNFPQKDLQLKPPSPTYLESLQHYLQKWYDFLWSPSDQPASGQPSPLFQSSDAIIVPVSPIHIYHKFMLKWEGPLHVHPSRFQVLYNYSEQGWATYINSVKRYKCANHSPHWAAGPPDVHSNLM